MNALEAAVLVMATPDSPVPLQARTELLTGLTAAYSAQKATTAFDLEDTEALLRWSNAFARYPLGVDDVSPVSGVLPPVQKLVLQLLSQLSPVSGTRCIFRGNCCASWAICCFFWHVAVSGDNACSNGKLAFDKLVHPCDLLHG